MDRKPTDSISRSTSSSRMSHSSDEGDQNKASSCRKWVEPQSVPSRCLPSRQGYCGYCRVFYGNLNQHLSSLKHLDSVRTCSQDSSTVYSTSLSGTSQTLLERFLHDVLQYHPHLYEDTRPSHADLPSVSTPPLPRKEFHEACFSDQTREHLLSPVGTCFPLADYDGNCHLVTEDVLQEGLPGPIGEWVEERMTPLVHEQTPPPPTQTQPTVHRKAHRKTNRRKNSNDKSPPQRGPDPGSEGPTELGPWLSWQKERREAQKEQAFSLDLSDPLDQTIEEVIQRCCHGIRSTSCQQEESESFHFSLPLSMETQTNDWDSDVQVALQTPVLISHVEAKDLSHLMLVQVDLEDQVYTYHLDCALQHERQAGHGARQEEGCWTLPIEEVLPAPEHIPESFRGKTWAQIEQEDDEKVEKLVQQFRREKFICYFDSESLARFGRRSNKKRWHCENKEVVRGNGVLPLLDITEEDSAYIRRKRGKRHMYRVASRCQAVKVSHSTQTVRAVVPAVREQASEIPSSNAAANQDASAERTPDAQTWHRLPASYLKIMTPLQPRTSLVYLLCSPSSSTNTAAVCPTRKHCRKKRRPLDLQGFKVTYKQLPVRFYEPSSNRILKNPPKGFLRHRGSTSSSVPPSCVRQLFRNLSPDLNADAHSFFLSTCDRDVADADKQHTVRRRDRMSQAPPYSRLERGRGLRKERTCPVVSKSTVRTEAPAPQSRRGLRQAGCDRKDPNPPYSVQSRQRNCRGRGRKRRQR